MTFGTVIFLVVGLPLILLCGGFFFLILHIFKGRDETAERNAQTLALAQQLERTLSKMENRLGALEDIIISPSVSAKEGSDERKNDL